MLTGMCGRYASFRQAQQVADEFQVLAITQAALDIEASWNLPPTVPVRVIIDQPAETLEKYTAATGDTIAVGLPDSAAEQNVVRVMHAARWGLVPPWSKDMRIGARMINARSETVDTKRSFKAPFSTSRCIVTADGYYEWHTAEDGAKTPYYIYPTHGETLAFAGLYSWWNDRSDPQAPWILTTTILTAAARDGLEEIHDREPVMLTPETITPWLDPNRTSPDEILPLLNEPGPELSWHPVTKAVGSVRNNTPSLITPVPHPQNTQSTLL